MKINFIVVLNNFIRKIKLHNKLKHRVMQDKTTKFWKMKFLK
jgi:hypothetical protein